MSILSRLLFWLPAVVWAALIFTLSATPNLSFGQGPADFLIRKTGHLLTYMVLSCLVYTALQKSWKPTWDKQTAFKAALISVAYAITDEIHQSTIPTRHGSLVDVLIDTAGVGLGLAVVGWLDWWSRLTDNPWTPDNLTAGTKVIDLHQLPAFATALAQQFKPGSVIALHGDLGAGKTTLTTHLARALGVTKKMSSPTYTIVKQYQLSDHGHLYHYDWYRLHDQSEVEQLGFAEVIEQADGIIIIEWPERAPGLLPDHTIHLYLEHVDQQTRKITINR